MHNYRLWLCLAAILSMASFGLTGCTYAREMAKAEANRSRINDEMQVANANQQYQRSRTAPLEAERGTLSNEIAAQKRTLAAQQRRLAALSVVPAHRRSSGHQMQVTQVQSEIVKTQRRIAEKSEQYRNLNAKI